MDNSASLANQSTSNLSVRTQQFVCSLLAIVCLIWSLTDSRFRDAEGFVRAAICLPISAAIALGLLSYALGKIWRTAAAWMSLALIGQAVALQMIEAGQHIKYQHYRTIPALLTSSPWLPWLMVLLAIQTALVLIGFRGRWSQVKSWLSRNFKFWQLAGIALAFVFTSATVSREVSLYVQELPLAAFVQTINLLNLVLAMWAIPEATLTAWRVRVERITGWEGNEESRIAHSVDRFAVTAAISATVLAATLSFFSYQRHPHLGDEIAYLYHARYLATGVLTMPTPTPLEAFDLDLFDHDATRWYGSPPVGWPLVLALGVLVKADWLVNPLLAGVCVLLAFLLVRELYDRRTARLTALLLALSPWHALVGMSYMTHTASLTFVLLAAVAAAWARKSGNVFWALLSGASVGMVGMIRPLEGAIVGGLIGLWIIGIGGKRLKISGLAAWALGCAVIGAAIFYYNFALTGSPTKFPIMVWADKYMGVNSNAMGFGPDRGNGWPIDPYPGHSPLEGVINSNLNISAINTELFGWSIGSLLLIVLLCFSLKLHKSDCQLRRSDWKMAALIAAVFTAHFFYWFSGGPDFAARYWYLMIVPCVVLSVRGLQVLISKLAHSSHHPCVPKTRALIGVLSLSLMALTNFTVWRAIDKYHHYNGMRPDVLRLAKEHNFGKSLILIRGEQFPDFASAAIYNPIDLQADAPVYAWDQNQSLRNQVLKLYSDRPVWIVNGPSLTKAGFQLVEGPISAQTLLERQQTAFR